MIMEHFCLFKSYTDIHDYHSLTRRSFDSSQHKHLTHEIVLILEKTIHLYFNMPFISIIYEIVYTCTCKADRGTRFKASTGRKRFKNKSIIYTTF